MISNRFLNKYCQSVKLHQPITRKFTKLKNELSNISNSDLRFISRELMFNKKEMDSTWESSNLNMFDNLDFIYENKNFELFQTTYKQIKKKFRLDQRQFWMFKFSIELLREFILKNNNNSLTEDEFFETMKWMLKSMSINNSDILLNQSVVRLSSLVQDILYLIIHFSETQIEERKPHKGEFKLSSESRDEIKKYVGLIFTNHPCALNKDEEIYKELLQNLENAYELKLEQSKLFEIKIKIEKNLNSLLYSDFHKLKPKVKEETLTLQNEVLAMSEALMEQSHEFHDIKIKLDSWTGIEADRNATTPELQLQTILLNKLKGFEVYSWHLQSVINLLHQMILESKYTDSWKPLREIIQICEHSIKHFKEFDKNIKKGLDIATKLSELIVFKFLRNVIINNQLLQNHPEMLQMTMVDFWNSKYIKQYNNDDHKYIKDSIQQFFSSLTVKEFLGQLAISFIPKVFDNN